MTDVAEDEYFHRDPSTKQQRETPNLKCASHIAMSFHENYEALAPGFGWETQERSRKEWGDVPPENRKLMVAVAATLLELGVIKCGEHDASS